MRTSFETKLESAEGVVDGMVQQVNDDGTVWEFKSIDGNVHIVVGRDDLNNWLRIDGTKPYLSSWTEELVNKITNHH